MLVSDLPSELLLYYREEQSDDPLLSEFISEGLP